MKWLAMVVVIAVAIGVAVVCWNFMAGQAGAPKGSLTYSGEEAFTEEGFGEFKAFVGRPGVKLLDLGVVDNSTTPVTMRYLLAVEGGIECSYGERTAGESPYMLAVGATVGAFVAVCLIGIAILNAMGIQRW